MGHWLIYWSGLTPNQHGSGYSFWSGIGGHLETAVAPAAVLWRAHICHEDGCWRIGRHPAAHERFCRRHYRKAIA